MIVARQNERADGDDLVGGSPGSAARNPWLAWPMTIAMLALAGIPGTVGFIGKFQLIHALVDGDYTWLAIVLVIGSMISLGYYLRVVATMWMRPRPRAGPGLAPASPPAPGWPGPDRRRLARGRRGRTDRGRRGNGRAAQRLAGGPVAEVAFVAVLFGAASIFFGIFPSPLFQLAAHAGRALTGLF